MALPGRRAAHGYQALRALRASQLGGHGRARANPSKGAGYEFAHSIVDDHSRLVYSEIQDDERASTVVGFVERAPAFFGARGISAKRLMTDNAWSYTHSRGLSELLQARRIKHVLIELYRPQQNGKVERFQQTMAREWAYGLQHCSSAARRHALPHWIAYYNERRPHSGIGDRPPSVGFTTCVGRTSRAAPAALSCSASAPGDIEWPRMGTTGRLIARCSS